MMISGLRGILYLVFVNFLAHAYLSFNHPEVLVGNMISDFVKGKAQYDFPEGIQRGIRLHRMIDDFTDTHAATKSAKAVFKKDYRLYSAPVTDVVYDYFLANDDALFNKESLLHFSRQTYQTLDVYTQWLPPRFAWIFEFMKEENWLLNYGTEKGICKSLHGLMRRSSFADDGAKACALFVANKTHLQQCYNALMPDVKHFAKARLDEFV